MEKKKRTGTLGKLFDIHKIRIYMLKYLANHPQSLPELHEKTGVTVFVLTNFLIHKEDIRMKTLTSLLNFINEHNGSKRECRCEDFEFELH